jgi:hypothetical protein
MTPRAPAVARATTPRSGANTITTGGCDIVSARDRARRIARIEDEMKAEDIRILDVKRICSFTDMVVLCTGNSRSTRA